MRRLLPLALISTLAVSACATVEPEIEQIVIEPAPVQTCIPLDQLEKRTIPAVTRQQTAITMIDNPPYEPIETRTQRTIIVTPAEVLYVNAEGKEALDICEKGIEIGQVGPAAGAILDANGDLIIEE